MQQFLSWGEESYEDKLRRQRYEDEMREMYIRKMVMEARAKASSQANVAVGGGSGSAPTGWIILNIKKLQYPGPVSGTSGVFAGQANRGTLAEWVSSFNGTSEHSVLINTVTGQTIGIPYVGLISDSIFTDDLYWEGGGSEDYADDTWEVEDFPGTINFLGKNYDVVYIGTNGYLTFGAGEDQYGLPGIEGEFSEQDGNPSPSQYIYPGIYLSAWGSSNGTSGEPGIYDQDLITWRLKYGQMSNINWAVRYMGDYYDEEIRSSYDGTASNVVYEYVYSNVTGNDGWISVTGGAGGDGVNVMIEPNKWVTIGANDGYNNGWTYVKKYFPNGVNLGIDWAWTTQDGIEYDWPFVIVLQDDPGVGMPEGANDDRNSLTDKNNDSDKYIVNEEGPVWVCVGVYSDDSVEGPGKLVYSFE